MEFHADGHRWLSLLIFLTIAFVERRLLDCLPLTSTNLLPLSCETSEGHQFSSLHTDRVLTLNREMSALESRMPVAARLARTQRCHCNRAFARTAFIDTSTSLMPTAPLQGRADTKLNDMVATKTVTPRYIAALTLHQLHANLANPNVNSAESNSPKHKSFPLREKCGLFLSVCTVLISVQVLLPRTL